MIAPRLRAEEAMIDRILGLPPGSVALAWARTSDLEALLARWGSGLPDQSREGRRAGALRERLCAGDFQT